MLVNPSGVLPNTAVIEVEAGWGAPVALLGGQEYDAFKLVLSNDNTVGAGACAGCATAVDLTFEGMYVDAAGGRREFACSPLQNQCITWQGGTGFGCGTCDWCGGTFNCTLVPARNVTWGRVKSFYR